MVGVGATSGSMILTRASDRPCQRALESGPLARVSLPTTSVTGPTG